MSDFLGGISNTYTNNLTYIDKTTSSLENTLNSSALSTASDDELMQVCKEFEEYFAEQMVKSMLKMAKVEASDEDNSYASLFGLSSGESQDSAMSTMTDYFGGEMVTQLSKALCDDSGGKGLGLAKTLYEQMKRNYSIQEV